MADSRWRPPSALTAEDLPPDEPELAEGELHLTQDERDELEELALLLQTAADFEPSEQTLRKGRNELLAQIHSRPATEGASPFRWVRWMPLLAVSAALGVVALFPWPRSGSPLPQQASTEDRISTGPSPVTTGSEDPTDRPQRPPLSARRLALAPATEALVRVQAQTLSDRLQGEPTDESRLRRAELDYRTQLLASLEASP